MRVNIFRKKTLLKYRLFLLLIYSKFTNLFFVSGMSVGSGFGSIHLCKFSCYNFRRSTYILLSEGYGNIDIYF